MSSSISLPQLQDCRNAHAHKSNHAPSHKKTVRERENEGDRERGRQREERMAVLVKLALVLTLLGAAACRETFHEWTKQVAAVEGS